MITIILEISSHVSASSRRALNFYVNLIHILIPSIRSISCVLGYYVYYCHLYNFPLFFFFFLTFRASYLYFACLCLNVFSKFMNPRSVTCMEYLLLLFSNLLLCLGLLRWLRPDKLCMLRFSLLYLVCICNMVHVTKVT